MVRTRFIAELLVVALLSASFCPAWAQQSSEPSSEQSQAPLPQAPSSQGPSSQAPGPASPAASPAEPSTNERLPDSPGAVPQQRASMQSGTQQSQPPTHEPVGTAAAESVPTMGVAAARPAGVAMAPAKQHRVRIFLIKMGALVGAGVAIGTAVALSQASPSKPPGAR